jgi:hypothetical protein
LLTSATRVGPLDGRVLAGLAAAAVATATVLFASERGVFEGWVSELTAILGLITVAFLTTGVLALARPRLGLVALAVYGMGIGFLCYRFVYGILLPIPERRLDRVPDQAV